jgi:hypothetical protein
MVMVFNVTLNNISVKTADLPQVTDKLYHKVRTHNVSDDRQIAQVVVNPTTI